MAGSASTSTQRKPSTRRFTKTTGLSLPDRLDLLVAQQRGEQDEPVDVLGERVDQLELVVGVVVAVAEQGRQVAAAQPVLRRLDHLGEQRVRQVGHDEADVPGLPGGQRGGAPAGHVVEQVRGGVHPPTRLLAEQFGLGEHPGDGRDGDVRGARYVANGRPGRHRVSDTLSSLRWSDCSPAAHALRLHRGG